METILTNLIAIATIVLSTNVVESVHPSGSEKWQTTTIVATVGVEGWTTNRMTFSTNTVRFMARIVWEPVPLYPDRDPLSITNPVPAPPILPGVSNVVIRGVGPTNSPPFTP